MLICLSNITNTIFLIIVCSFVGVCCRHYLFVMNWITLENWIHLSGVCRLQTLYQQGNSDPDQRQNGT